MPTPHAEPEGWELGVTYVIGHQRPDTDAIAAALGYAWYLTASGHERVRPTRAGPLGPQALFALERFNQAPPRLLTAVAPTFGHAAQPQEPVSPDAPLSEALERLGQGARLVPVVDGAGRPLGVVTPLALAQAFSRSTHRAELLTQPCGSIVQSPPAFRSDDRISDYRGTLLRNDTDDFLITNDVGRYVGIATRSHVLAPPRARLILVDHNELAQAITGADEAEIIGVLDHHRLGNPSTVAPIPFLVEPVGSTCTLVAEQCRAHGIQPPPALAGMMLSGILSDTLVFRSPTTTSRDRAASEWLAGLVPLEALTFGEELLRAAPGLSDRPAADILDADRKSYEMAGKQVSVSQVEVTTLQELPDRRQELLAALDERRQREGLALIGLMVTDVVTGYSHLLCQGERRFVAALPFTHVAENEFDLGTIISRKKQLVPLLHGVLEHVG